MAMSTEKTLVVNAMCNTNKFLSLGNNTHSCISHTIHKYNNYVITLVCVTARVTPALVDDHCYITPSSSFLRPRKTRSLLTHNLHNVEGVDDFLKEILWLQLVIFHIYHMIFILHNCILNWNDRFIFKDFR